MAETVDVQELTIGVGTVIAIALLAYGTVVADTILGVDATTLAIGAFALTFLSVGALHGAYGRRDFALAHLAAGVGLGLVAIAASLLQLLGGYALLLVGGGYVAVATVRAREK
ncbi:hypothetical protein [Halobiforma nitratireducens]|uniref:Uncharacterized protein n=1 Tax=Halobiforma nitratireducens JCM 10879 TaxID=1227454 RepID=M0M953_9EURY|nr:hypothetical protein [Halobiforma nitratireducens]EMA42322.1 hypothetical protein C446_04315 [Halobiforma nitratireducens JCM 10879]